MTDLVHALRGIYSKHESLEEVFANGFKEGGSLGGIMQFRAAMLASEHQPRFEKHIANPALNGAAKRINMFLRWMVRSNTNGVDFGIWKNISPADLICPIDIHVARVAKKLGLLTRKAVDWNAAIELTNRLKEMDPLDPVKYDFALFALGAAERH